MGTGFGLTEVIAERIEMLEQGSETTFSKLSFEEKLDRFAQVAVHIGLNLRWP